MIITQLDLKNFKSHKCTKLQFDRGITVILGQNGAGKSSIFEAINYSLFGTGGDELIRHNSNSMSIKMEFISKGNKYRIEKNRKKGKTEINLYSVLGNRNKILSSGLKNVMNDIKQILGFDTSLFQNAIYIKQGEIAKLITDQPAERKTLITKLIGAESLEKVWRNMSEIISIFDRKSDELKGQVQSIPELQAEYKENQDNLEITEKLMGESTISLKLFKDNLIELKKQQSVLDIKRESSLQLTERLKSEKRNVIIYKKQVERNKNELDGIKIAENDIKRLEPDLTKLKPIENIKSMITENEKSEINRDNLQSQIKSLMQELDEKRHKLNNVIIKDSKILGIENSYLKVLNEALSNSINKTEEFISNFEIEIKKCTVEKTEIQTKMKRIKESLIKINISEGSCPLCEKPLTEKHKADLIKKYDKDLSTLKIKLDLSSKSYSKLIEDNKNEKKKQKKLLSIKIDVLRKEESILSEIKQKVAKIQPAFQDLENKVKLKNSQIDKKLTLLNLERGQIEGEIKKLKKIETEYIKKSEKIKRKSELETEFKINSKELSNSIKEVKKFEVALESIGYNKVKDEKHQANLEKNINGYNNLERNHAKLVERETNIKKYIKNIGKKLKSLENAKKELDRTDRFLEVLKKVRNDVFYKDASQKKLRELYKPIIEMYTREFFNEFNFEYTNIKIDENYIISVSGSSGVTEINMVSGGEKIAIAIALRLGIAKALLSKESSGMIELIMIDEPTIHLDIERRKELITIFQKLIRIPQVFIVTHDLELQKAATSILKIRKEKGVSILIPPLKIR